MSKRFALGCCLLAVLGYGCTSDMPDAIPYVDCTKGNKELHIKGLLIDDLHNPTVPDNVKELIDNGRCPETYENTPIACMALVDEDRYPGYQRMCVACGNIEEIRCDGVCIDGVSNPNNCGKCGNKCGEGESCIDGYCRVCKEGDFKCSGNQSSQCVNNEWKLVDECKQTTCDESTGKCRTCENGSLICSEENDKLLYMCTNGSWGEPTECTDYKCGIHNGIAKCLKCEIGNKRCSSDSKAVETCEGLGWNSEDCEYKCADKKCIECDDDYAFKCDENNQNVKKCENNQWVDGDVCQFGCTEGVCNECAEGSYKCDENGVNQMVCKNHHWETQPCLDGCSNSRCNDHVCDQDEKRCSPDNPQGIEKCSANTYLSDSTCGTNEVCDNSNNVVSCKCAEGFDKCGNACVDLKTDPKNCNECGNDVGSYSCKDGEACVESKKSASSNEVDDLTCCSSDDGFYLYLAGKTGCNKNLKREYYCHTKEYVTDSTESNCYIAKKDSSHLTDVNSCGINGNFKSCGDNSTCVDGECDCKQGYTKCGDKCVDLKTDDNHCGKCNNKAGEHQSCSNGQLVCNAPYNTNCGTSAKPVCVNIKNDNENCGQCGKSAPNGQYCVNGVLKCSDTSKTVCSGVCVDTKTDINNCGGCGVKVSDTTNYTCKNGNKCVKTNKTFSSMNEDVECCENTDMKTVYVVDNPACTNGAYRSKYNSSDAYSKKYCAPITTVTSVSTPGCFIDVVNYSDWKSHISSATSCGINGNYSSCILNKSSDENYNYIVDKVCKPVNCCYDGDETKDDLLNYNYNIVCDYMGTKRLPGGKVCEINYKDGGTYVPPIDPSECCTGHLVRVANRVNSYFMCTSDLSICDGVDSCMLF